jgi:cold-inducible RNA-binding protein
MNIYIGNLPYSTTESDLETTFSVYGPVTRTKVIMDRETGRSRGFGFVEMASDDQGRAAIEALNGSDMGGRKLVVNEARPKG